MNNYRFNHPPHNHGIVSSSGEVISSLQNAINVHNADVHRAIFNDFVHRHTGTNTTLSAQATAGDISLSVNSTTGFAIGDYIHLGPLTGSLEPVHLRVTAIVAGTTLTLDRPLDHTWAASTLVTQTVVNLASTAGTLASPISYKYWAYPGRVEHVKRFIISMTHTSAGTDDNFGNLSALTNGVVLRVQSDGVVSTYTNWKRNSDLILDMFDIVYTDKAGPSSFGLRGNGEFNPIGSIAYLDGNQGDYVELLVQDNLTALTSFRVKVQGHIEGI